MRPKMRKSPKLTLSNGFVNCLIDFTVLSENSSATYLKDKIKCVKSIVYIIHKMRYDKCKKKNQQHRTIND